MTNEVWFCYIIVSLQKPTQNQIWLNSSVNSSTEMCQETFVTCFTHLQDIIFRENVVYKSGEARNMNTPVCSVSITVCLPTNYYPFSPLICDLLQFCPHEALAIHLEITAANSGLGDVATLLSYLQLLPFVLRSVVPSVLHSWRTWVPPLWNETRLIILSSI